MDLKIKLKEAYTGEGKIINSDFLNDLDVSSAKQKIISEIEKKNLGQKSSLPIERLGYFKAKILGLPNTYDLS